MSQIPFSLYLHFPYCSHRCPYCDFNVHVRKQIPENQFIAAIIAEAKFRSSLSEWKARKISTIFLGGGTPSLFSQDSILKLLSELKTIWDYEDNIEISIEANPDNLCAKKLQALKAAGVNRLSIGAQSLSDKFLKTLGRNHTGAETVNAFKNARIAGLKNINIDLMFALPNQTLSELKDDIRAVLALQPDHISYYSLTIEAGTPFYERQLSGALNTPSNDQAAIMMEEIIGCLNSHGYFQYEISNFSKTGFNCRHNQAYWQSKDYLGLGPGAHSAFSINEANRRVGMRRWSNKATPERYLETPTQSEAWSETVEGANLVFESLLLGLRQCDGIAIDKIIENLNEEQKIIFWNIVRDLSEEKFLMHNQSNARIQLTNKGLMLADSITERFAVLCKADKSISNCSIG